MMSLPQILFKHLCKKTINSDIRTFFTGSATCREFRKNKRLNIVKVDDGVPSPRVMDIEPSWMKKCDFPDENTPNLVFNGIRFADLPIMRIKISPNNTILGICDKDERTLDIRSCGTEGFKNCRKKSNIAAQAAAIAMATRCLKRGIKQIRVLIKGLGPGRMASIKGLEMGGMDIISITDGTPTIIGGNRPRKARRI